MIVRVSHWSVVSVSPSSPSNSIQLHFNSTLTPSTPSKTQNGHRADVTSWPPWREPRTRFLLRSLLLGLAAKLVYYVDHRRSMGSFENAIARPATPSHPMPRHTLPCLAFAKSPSRATGAIANASPSPSHAVAFVFVATVVGVAKAAVGGIYVQCFRPQYSSRVALRN